MAFEAEKSDIGNIAEGQILGDRELDILFRSARTYSKWKDQSVSDVMLKAVFDLFKMAPTSANCSPARVIFVKSAEEKQRLKPCMAEGNIEKTMNAPVTAIIAMDNEFHEQLPKLYPHTDARSWYVGKDKLINETAMRNSSLQGAYLIMAARALGLDCGPMSGFNPDKIKEAFFNDKNWTANFLCNLGCGDETGLHSRSPRFEFDDACEII